MDWSTLLDSMQNALGDKLPSILGALAILVGGWIAAIVVRIIVKKFLRFLKINERIRTESGSELNVESGVASGAYYLVLILALIGFFNALSLQLVTGPLHSLADQVFAYAPRLAAAALLGLAAWIVALILRKLVTKALEATKLDEKLTKEASLGNVLYWLVILLFLPAILGALAMEGLLEPVQGMVHDIVGLVPNLFAAALIGLVGWFVARLLRDLVTNLLAATGLDAFGERSGLKGKMALSRLAGLLVYIFVLLPALIAALDAMRIQAISAPATEMLRTLMAAIPSLFAAGVILGVTFFLARIVANLLTTLLAGIGFDELPGFLGVRALFSGDITASKFVGKLVIFFAMVFAAVEAASQLGFSQVSALVATFIEFGGQVLLGAVIIGVGLWISNLAHNALSEVGGPNSVMWAGLARFAILGLVFAMGFRAMGIADDIVNLAFGLTLGTVAVAVALSFGLGGREAAGRQMERWLGRLSGEK